MHSSNADGIKFLSCHRNKDSDSPLKYLITIYNYNENGTRNSKILNALPTDTIMVGGPCVSQQVSQCVLLL